MFVRKMQFGSVEIAQPAEIQIKNNKIWSNNAGRGANCIMVGDICDIKKTLSITWYHLSPAQVKEINNFISNVDQSFFTVSFPDEEFEYITISVYAGDPTYDVFGWDENRQFCKGVTVDLIQQ